MSVTRNLLHKLPSPLPSSSSPFKSRSRIHPINIFQYRQWILPLNGQNPAVAYSTYRKVTGHRQETLEFTPKNRQTSRLTRQVPIPIPTGKSTHDLDLDQFIASLERQPKQSLGRTFLHAWVDHMITYPGNLANVSWPEIIRRCKEMDRSIDDLNFSGILFQVCAKARDITVGEEYLKWDKKPSLSVLTLFIRSLADESRDVNELQILELYEKIKLMNRDVWDFQSGERVIWALVRTSKWKECLDIVKKMEAGGPVPPGCYSHIATAAFQNKEFELGWSIFQLLKHNRISDKAFVSYLENVEETEENVVKLLDFMDLHEHFPTDTIVKALQAVFENSLGYSASSSNILPSKGSCMNCKTQLERTGLSGQEYNFLVDAFMNKVMKDEDIFLNTTPVELKFYRDFIAAKGPFDFVLDGLNVAYARGNQGPLLSVQTLETLVRQLSTQGSRILVIGRKHMARWPQKSLQAIQRVAYMHLINNDSNDDPFIIYATLQSGPKAKFVSKDEMRNHTFRLLDPILARLFKRWRLSHQLTIENRGPPPHLRLVPFTEILPVPQKNLQNGIWHIPYELDRLLSPYDLPSKWLCLQPTKRNK